MKLTFPTRKYKYYDTYCYNLKLNFEMVNAEIELDPHLPYLAPAIFYFKVNDKLALIDYSDFMDEYAWNFNVQKGFFRVKKHYDYNDIKVPIFKRTMAINEEYPDNVFPYGPFMPINSPQEYNYLLSLKDLFKNNKRTKILHTNRIYAAAVITRKIAFSKIDNSKLVSEVSFDKTRLPKTKHLNRLGECIGSLEIGACPNAQGSGAIEGFLTGTPIITNNMDIKLPYNKEINKYEHYIYIEEDYNNINDAINYVYTNKQDALEKAEKVYELFINTWHPSKLVPWITQTIEEYYEK